MKKKILALVLTVFIVYNMIAGISLTAFAASYPMPALDLKETTYTIEQGTKGNLCLSILCEYKNEAYHVEIYNSKGVRVAYCEDTYYNSSSTFLKTVDISVDTSKLQMSVGRYKVVYWCSYYSLSSWHDIPTKLPEYIYVIENKCNGNHNLVFDSAISSNVSCSNKGTVKLRCTKCDYYTYEEGYGEHSFGQWVTVDSNKHKHTCSECGTSETTSHSWNAGTAIKNASCSETGIKRFTCVDCGATKDENIPKTDHIGIWENNDDSTHKRVCTVCGTVEIKAHTYATAFAKNKTMHWHQCTVCGNKTDVANHTFENAVCTSCEYGKKIPFPDVNYTAWYGEPIIYAVGTGLMKGYGSGKFGTSDGIQRQDFVVILSRLSGDDLSKYEGKTSFKDVAKGAYYATALAWAKDKGVSSGYANGKFGVGDKVTREQIMVFLYNYAKLKGYDTTATLTEAQAKATYADFGKVSGYAKEAALWALSKGVVSGKDAGGGKKLIAPNLNALRCEVAAMFYNIEEKSIFVN